MQKEVRIRNKEYKKKEMKEERKYKWGYSLL